MDLAEAIGDDVIEALGDLAYEPSCVANDHRKVTGGGLFVCVKGFVADGHGFAPGAFANGAAVLVSQKPFGELDLPRNAAPDGGAPDTAEPDSDIPDATGALRGPLGETTRLRAFLRVRDSRRALAAAAHLYYNEPTKRILLAGVTGTKGKTTTVYMIRSILAAAGLKCGMLGTIENDVGSEIVPATATTPESVDLAAMFSAMAAHGCGHAVMETSSQGLALSRVDFCDYDVGVFTNLYNDHISPHEHADANEYFSAKLKLFSMCKKAVINADIEECDAVKDAFHKNGGGGAVLTYSADEAGGGHTAADVRASGIELVYDGSACTRFHIETPWFSGPLTVGLPGRYNISNALAAVSVCGLWGVPFEAVRDGLRRVCVRGRTQSVDGGQDFTVLVDYAHNAASLSALLHMLREYNFHSITTVFGCGGNRARDRRFEMGETSGKLSGFTVITSDNPRGEDPRAIMADIEIGLLRTAGQYIMIEDRLEAIRYAIDRAGKDSLVLIAGKGHETEQEFADRTIHFDDAGVALELLRNKKNPHYT